MSAVVLVFAYGLVTALATGLGALPFLTVRTVSARMVGRLNAASTRSRVGSVG